MNTDTPNPGTDTKEPVFHRDIPMDALVVPDELPLDLKVELTGDGELLVLDGAVEYID